MKKSQQAWKNKKTMPNHQSKQILNYIKTKNYVYSPSLCKSVP